MSRVMSPPATPQQPTMRTTASQPTHEQIAMRAYEKWVKRGRPHGFDRQDWLEAEVELKKEFMSTRR